ncbi:FMRFamide-related peptides type HF-4 [Labeo rohita]|uniref:FMRFamide-related peptides type HF-4 n=1 Tax=Labeo rohita TaxID=84645 RepID=A0ABQ8LIX9_LABRO|nr:FMRFamide-related peptides type HF-4 [Labeo rohita]
MDNPAVLLLLLELGNRSLVDHTRDFVHLVPLTHYPDSSLCTFYRAGLNIATKAQLSGEDPEPSQPAPRHAEFEPEPTADDEPEPRATESKIATEPEPYTSDQVREPATTTTTGECKMEQVRAMESPAHCTTAGGELENDSGDLIDSSTEALENNSGDLIDFFTEISTCHVIPAWYSPELRLGPPTLRLHHGSQRPRLHCRPSVHQLHWAPSSFRLRPGRSSSLRHLRTLFVRLRLVTPSHRLLRTPPSLWHSLHPLSLRLRRGPPDLRLRLGRQSLGLRLGPPDPRCRPGSSALRLRLGLLRQRLRLRRSAPWSRQPFLHHGSSLRRLHRGSSSWLRSGSPSASPAPGPSCFLLGSFHLRHPPGLCYVYLNCLSGHGLLNRPPTLLFFFLYVVRRETRLFGGGRNVTFMSVCLLVSPIVSPRSVCFGLTLITVIPYTCVCN